MQHICNSLLNRVGVEVEDTTFEAKTKESKKPEVTAKDRLSEDRPSRGREQERSSPRTKTTIFLNYARQIFHNVKRKSVKILHFVNFLIIRKY